MRQEQGLGEEHKGLVHRLAAQELDFSVRNVVNSVPCIQAQERKQSSLPREAEFFLGPNLRRRIPDKIHTGNRCELSPQVHCNCIIPLS